MEEYAEYQQTGEVISREEMDTDKCTEAGVGICQVTLLIQLAKTRDE